MVELGYLQYEVWLFAMTYPLSHLLTGDGISSETRLQASLNLVALGLPPLPAGRIPEDELGRLLESCVSAGVGLKVAEGEEWAKLSPLRVIPRVLPVVPAEPGRPIYLREYGSLRIVVSNEKLGGGRGGREGGNEKGTVAPQAESTPNGNVGAQATGNGVSSFMISVTPPEYVLFCEFDGVRTLGEALGRARRSGARLGEAEAAAFTARLKRNNFVYLDVIPNP